MTRAEKGPVIGQAVIGLGGPEANDMALGKHDLGVYAFGEGFATRTVSTRRAVTCRRD